MKRYEGLFILKPAGGDEGVGEAIDRISAAITGQGGAIETVQKMDKRAFTRVTDKSVVSGFYVNIIFSAEPSAIEPLRSQFQKSEDVWRVLFTKAPRTAAVVNA